MTRFDKVVAGSICTVVVSVLGLIGTVIGFAADPSAGAQTWLIAVCGTGLGIGTLGIVGAVCYDEYHYLRNSDRESEISPLVSIPSPIVERPPLRETASASAAVASTLLPNSDFFSRCSIS